MENVNGKMGKQFMDRRNWPEYNEELVMRGKFLFDMDVASQWDNELVRMNHGKRDSPHLFPE